MTVSLRMMAAVCWIAGLSIASVSRADEPPAVERGTGKIVSITPERVTIQLKSDGGAERMLELTLNDQTRVVGAANETVRVVTGRGDVQELRKVIDAKIADLAVDHWVHVRHADGIAVQIFSAMIGPAGQREGGDRPRGDAPRELRDGGDRPAEMRREGDRARDANPLREGDRARDDERIRDGDRPRDGDLDGQRVPDRQRDGAAPREPIREGAAPSANAASLVVGDIASVEAGKLTVNLSRRNQRTGATTVVPLDTSTEVRIEGNAGKPTDLRPGMPVSVTVEKGVAVRIEVPIDLSKPRE